ncbi:MULTISPECIES: transposase [Streptomyces]|uniref:transposase n=1 Tax=Streptomyces TaxID=1883 RepID=UPI0036CDCA3E
MLVSWSHPGRFRSEAALASFAGVSPIPASSEPLDAIWQPRGVRTPWGHRRPQSA